MYTKHINKVLDIHIIDYLLLAPYPKDYRAIKLTISEGSSSRSLKQVLIVFSSTSTTTASPSSLSRTFWKTNMCP